MATAIGLAAAFSLVRLEAGQNQSPTYKSPGGTTLKLLLYDPNVAEGKRIASRWQKEP